VAYINRGDNAGSWHSFWEMPTGHDCVRFRGKTGKSSAKGQNDAIDPSQKWGERYPPMPSTAVTRTFLCNVLVCAAVWLAYAGRSVTDKMVAVILPVSAFIAAGFEHCVANMYFLPLAWLLVQTGHAPANFDASLVTMAGIIHNVVPVTLGNIVGGAGFVGAAYWAICRVTFGESR